MQKTSEPTIYSKFNKISVKENRAHSINMIRKEGLNISSSKAFELQSPISTRIQQKKVNIHNRFYAELQQ